jgi:RNA recognition motif-containing protein
MVLHVSNIKRDQCTTECLREMFSEAGTVERVSLLGSGKERSMALVKMISLEESFNAVGLLHGRNISGRKIQISFTKSRI